MRYGKTSQNAVSAMTALAEAYGKVQYLSSLDIAKTRGMSKPLVAKLLTTLSQGGLVSGVPGPSGGYFLARTPDKISLIEIVALFERVDDSVWCPMGPDWCGTGPQCPMHDELTSLNEEMKSIFERTTLAEFQK